MQKLLPAALFFLSVNALAVEQLPFDGETFTVEGAPAFIIEPEKRAAGNPWVWYAPTLQNLPNKGHAFYVRQFLDNGIAVAGYHQGEVRGGPASSKRFSDFYREVGKRGYSDKPILLGQSRGGLMMLSWAFRNPDKVGAFVGIYPVCNLASWPLRAMKQATLDDYEMTEAELLANLTRFNPPENLQPLAKAKVPFYLLYGDNDKVVPHNENSLLIENTYKKLGGPVEVKVVPGAGHTGGDFYFKEQALADFVLKVAKEIGANTKN